MDLAVRAAKQFGLLFTGVDLMETPDGGWVVLEVSALGGFRGLLTACGVDAATLIAGAALRRLREVHGGRR
jgi:ribosomal protein S6--L-glutamate ligase